jgi:hypothetical protein
VAIFNLYLDDHLAGRFDAWAADRGGRSLALRHLIDQASREGRATAFTPGGGERRPVNLRVRLSAADGAGLSAAAAEMGLTRNAWVAALVRHRLLGRPTFPPDQDVTLLAMLTELRRIAVGANQIARALSAATVAGEELDLELSYFNDLRAEVRGHMRDLFEAFEGNHTYWSVA